MKIENTNSTIITFTREEIIQALAMYAGKHVEKAYTINLTLRKGKKIDLVFNKCISVTEEK